MSFVGVGGAVGALVTAEWHADLSLAMLVAGLAGAVVAVVVGLPTLRVRGLFLAVTTLAFALASSEYLLNRNQMTWIPRQRLVRPELLRTFDLTTQKSMYYLCVAVLGLAFLAASGIRRSRSGRALVALRDNERGAQAFGINVVRTKLMAFALSGFLAAVAGCLLVHINQAFTEEPFTATESIGVFTAAVVGGLGSLAGAVIGAIYLNGGTWFLSDKWRLLPSAVGVLFILMVFPGGLGNLLYRARDAGLRRLAGLRGITVASLSADETLAPQETVASLAGDLATASLPSSDRHLDGSERPLSAGGRDGMIASDPSGSASADGAHTGLLVVDGLDVRYGDVQVLFGVDFAVEQGEIVVLLGTNGAGKSTLLKAVSGIARATGGRVLFDGHDITNAPPDRIAARGIAQVPGGQGVFTSLTVEENLRAACWLLRRDRQLARARTNEVFERFPDLADRLDQHAADLSGGQQQMLALSMAFLAQPKLLVIDELSLGLAPIIVDQLLDIVRAIRDQGTTVIVVEQSVNVALSLAETAYFMEKGSIRFHGKTAELLNRPDVLRSVFLEGAEQSLAGDSAAGRPAITATRLAAPPSVAPASKAAGGTALAVSHLSVRFGGIRAVDDVTFAVADGEVLGLIGPNGAGKTTVLDLISGFIGADHGTVSLLGVDVTATPPQQRASLGLGRSFQDSPLFPSLTVEETLLVALERWLDVRDPLNAVFRLPAFQDSEAAAQHRVDELIELMGIEPFRSKFIGELSTGSRRVVDLACVLAHEPTVVLLDEPSSGIAQREAEALGPLLLRVRDSLGASIVVIEHDMTLIKAVSDRLVALDRGRMIAEGLPSDVLVHRDVVDSYLGGELSPARSGPLATTDIARIT